MWDVLPFKDIFGAGFGIRDPVQVSYRGPGRNRASSGRIVEGMRKVEKEEEQVEEETQLLQEQVPQSTEMSLN